MKMKTLQLCLLLAVGALFGCAAKPTAYRVHYLHSPVSFGAFNRYPSHGPTTAPTAASASPDPANKAPAGMPVTQSILPPAEEKAPVTVGKAEVGVAIPERPGYLRSPYSPNAPPVDVRGFAPGSEVRDPENGRVFLVPTS